MTRPRGRFAKKNLLGTSVTVHGKRTTALLDSGCEAKLVISRRFADVSGIRYSPTCREVGLPDGSRMAAARSDPIDLTVAGVTMQEAVIVADIAALDCILGLPWLEEHNPVISWEMKLLVLLSTGVC
jgi:Aspartyl protease